MWEEGDHDLYHFAGCSIAGDMWIKVLISFPVPGCNQSCAFVVIETREKDVHG